MFIIVKNCLPGRNQLCICTERAASVRIPVDKRKIAACDSDPDSVSGLEYIACVHQANRELVDFSGLQEFR